MRSRATLVTMGLLGIAAALAFGWTLFGGASGDGQANVGRPVANPAGPRPPYLAATSTAPAPSGSEDEDASGESSDGVAPPADLQGKTLTLIAVDAVTGERLACRFRVGKWTVSAGEPCPLEQPGDLIPDVRVMPPPGYEEPQTYGHPDLAAEASRLEWYVPLHREGTPVTPMSDSDVAEAIANSPILHRWLSGERGPDPDDPALSIPDPREVEKSAGTGAVLVMVHDRHGVPQPNSQVNDRTGDMNGWTYLDRLPLGPLSLTAKGEGRLPAHGTVTVLPDATAEVTIREAEGCRLDVSVVDSKGAARSGAHLQLSSEWFDVRDGVQRLDLYTDRLGARSLARVQAGEVKVEAFWRGARGSAVVTLSDGGHVTVRIVTK